MNPYKMTVITNIQMMQDIINGKPEWERLQSLSLEELRNEQEKLIPKYNAAINNKKRK
jgi:hypothetical protein